MQKIFIIGNVGRVPTMRSNAKGVNFYEFSVGVNGRNDVCTWYSVLLSGQSKIAEYLTKGRQVFVEGAFSIDVYKGEPAITLFADNVQLLGTKNETTQENTPDTF